MSYVTVAELDYLDNEGLGRSFKKSVRSYRKRTVRAVRKPLQFKKKILTKLKPIVKEGIKITKQLHTKKGLKRAFKKTYYYAGAPAMWKKTIKKYNKELMMIGKIVIPVVGAILGPFTGGATIVAATMITMAIDVKQKHDKAKLAMKTARREERAFLEAEAKSMENEMEAQLTALYGSSLESHFHRHCYRKLSQH